MNTVNANPQDILKERPLNKHEMENLVKQRDDGLARIAAIEKQLTDERKATAIIRQEHAEALAMAKAEHARILTGTKEHHERHVASADEGHQTILASIKSQHEDALKRLTKENSNLQAQLTEVRAQLAESQKQVKDLGGEDKAIQIAKDKRRKELLAELAGLGE